MFDMYSLSESSIFQSNIIYSLVGEDAVIDYFYLNVFDGTIALRRSLVGVPMSTFSVNDYFFMFFIVLCMLGSTTKNIWLGLLLMYNFFLFSLKLVQLMVKMKMLVSLMFESQLM